MKIRHTIYALLMAGALGTSCADLDITPADQVSEGTFWKTKSDATQAVMGVYKSLKTGRAGMFLNVREELSSDLAIARGTAEVACTEGKTASTGMFGRFWRANYEKIQQANIAIRGIDKMGEGILAEDYLKFRAEVQFVRALAYLDLALKFGGVPIYDETTDITQEYNDLLKSRSSLEEVYALVHKDLDAGIQNLPYAWDNANYGRATKGSAYALKGKAFLFEKNYGKALENFSKLESDENFDYELFADYEELFKPKNNKNKEYIFAIQNKGGEGIDEGLPLAKYMGQRSTFGGGWVHVTPSQGLVEMYDKVVDGKAVAWTFESEFPGFENDDKQVRKDVFKASLASNKIDLTLPKRIDELKALYATLDERCNATVWLPYTTHSGWYGPDVAPKDMTLIITGDGKPHEKNGYVRDNSKNYSYVFRKFVPEGNENGLISSREHSPNAYPLLRLADVYLMMAECYNEQGDQAKAKEYIDRVRARANMPGIEESSKTEVFNRIMRERAVELVLEGHRYNDLIRWKKAEMLDGKVEKKILGNPYYTRVFDPARDYLWPIPEGEIRVNPKLGEEQNPNW
ncbi:hypothetical protein FUAX_17500 [Fulvitalea axinellae]|uniref:RagB/SusD family nutrient uptake outer membrane protein n=1 Tax=Fulvitalea axinellae TaxID=1182444 RepID=A0AAU9CMR9_9BACT|nr:hypothetical protein FUAX_17500 [Fulvitalea axinellae]